MNSLSNVAKRSLNLWPWLNIIWNSVDKDQIKNLGPDIACAQWLMRNGAYVRWHEQKEFVQHYDSVLKENVNVFIEEVEATESSIMYNGFDYFDQCNHIQKIKIHKCPYIDDKALEKLIYLKNSLKHLEISACPSVTDDGLAKLNVLCELKLLIVFDLVSVENLGLCVQRLKKDLPSLNVKYSNVQEK